MIDNKKILGIIPARAGSKGVKDKNIRMILEKPLIAYTIIEGIKSNVFDKLIVSTDSGKIAEISMEYGANVPFLRPKELAQDDSKTIDVIFHVLNEMENIGQKYDVLVLLQPTSPLRSSEDISNALNLFFEKNANSVLSVCETEHSSVWSNILPSNHSLDNFISDQFKLKRRQELLKNFRLNGAIYIADVNYLKKYRYWLHDNSYAYIMPRERSVDIDCELDLKFAEFLLKEKIENRSI